jgi:hypothetical protein
MRNGAPALAAAFLLISSAARAGEEVPVDWLHKPSLSTNPLSVNAPGQDTRKCELCHSPAGWSPAFFAHDRTGFPLAGAHQKVACKDCHTTDVPNSLAKTCGGCHMDVHRGDFGQRCEGCHTEETWHPLFTVDAHRRTNFPLIGRHAVLPCTECHFELRDRRFVRQTVDCMGCHAQDYLGTIALGISHTTLGFSTQCRDCHNAFRFQGAQFSEHDKCFPITTGKHSRIECLSCHSNLVTATVSGLCQTRTAACTGCHTHLCSSMNALHAKVTGYACTDQACLSCHPGGRHN